MALTGEFDPGERPGVPEWNRNRVTGVFGCVLIPALVLAQTKYAEPRVIVDGKPLSTRSGKTYKGRMLVPMRAIFEAVGAYVEYNPEGRTISARKNNETLDFRVGERVAKKNGAEIELDVAPVIIGRSVMVPLRFVTESLGARVAYDKSAGTINVYTGMDKDKLGSGGGEG